MARIRTSDQSAGYPASGNIHWLIAAYIRLSREDGYDESLSVTNQKKIISEYLDTCFEGEYTFAGYYVDDGLTGTDYDRPDFQRMLHDVETGKVNCIICKNLSRMFRNYSDQGYFLEKIFPMRQTRFIAISNPSVDSYLHPETLQGLEIPINGLMNDRFAAKTSLDVRNTFATKRRKGEFIGAFAPYGYKKDSENKNVLIVDEEAAEVVRDIYRWFVYDGMSKNGIARRLNERGIPNPAAYKRGKGFRFYCPQMEKNDGFWSPGSVTTILKNQVYTGTMVQGRQTVISYKVHDKVKVPRKDWYVVPGTHEPIIGEALFRKAAELQLSDTRTAPSGRNLHLLSGLIRCGDCKKAMTRQPSKSGVYYYCRTFREKSRAACTRHAIKEEAVINAVLLVIQTQIAMIDSLDQVVKMISRSCSTGKEKERLERLLQARQKELDRVNDIADGLYDDWKRGVLTREEYIRLKEKYSNQAGHLEGIIEHIRLEREGAENEEGEAFCLARFLKEKNISELNRGILVELVKNIYVHQGGGITIQFNFSDPYRSV